MTTLQIPVNSKPFLKTLGALGGREAGEAIDIIQPVYLDSVTDPEAPVLKIATSDPTDPTKSVVVGISVTQAETGSQCVFSFVTGDIIDFQGTLPAGSHFWLDRSGEITDDYSADIVAGDYVVHLGFTTEAGDWCTNIVDLRETK
jgi:hypothetical protein